MPIDETETKLNQKKDKKNKQTNKQTINNQQSKE